MMKTASRFLAYGVVGWAVDRAFTTVTRSRRQGRVVRPNAELALIPIYGLALPLFGPVHAAIWPAPVALRAAIYGIGFIAAEYAIARAAKGAFGRAPWDYAGARWSIHGHTRLDYLPLWAIAGLALERVHGRRTTQLPGAGGHQPPSSSPHERRP